VVRRAGDKQASKATRQSGKVLAAKVKGSGAVIPNRKDLMTLVSQERREQAIVGHNRQFSRQHEANHPKAEAI
jgi:hypothetical protein